MPYEQIGNKEPVCIADEVPFEIPESWEWCRLGSIVYNHGQKKPDKQFSYIDIGSIDNHHQCLNTNETLLEAEKAPSRARKLVCMGDILYATVRPYLHNMCIVNREFMAEPIASTGFAVLSCFAGMSNEFLFYYLMSPAFDSYANDSENSKGVAYPAINDTRLYNALIPLPPYLEQLRIVEKYQELLPFIEEYTAKEHQERSLNDSVPDQLRKSILQYAVQGKLVPQDPDDEPASALLDRIRAEKEQLIAAGKIKRDKHESAIYRKDNSHYEKINGVERSIDDEIPFEIPKSWEWARLKTIFNVVSARRVHQSDWKSEGIPFYRAREIAKLAEYGHVDNDLFISEELFEEYSKGGVPKKGDLMVTTVGTLGKTYIVKETDKFYYKDASVLCFENFGGFNPSFMELVMRSPFMDVQIKDNSAGTTVATLTIIKANEYLIPVPPATEQCRIVHEVMRLFAFCKKMPC